MVNLPFLFHDSIFIKKLKMHKIYSVIYLIRKFCILYEKVTVGDV